jgi:tight adherence protein B
MSSTALVSAALAAAACFAAVSCGGGPLLTRRLPAAGGGAPARPPRRAGVATALAASLAAAAWYRFSVVLVAAVAAAAALGLVTLRRRAVSRRSAAARSAAVMEICDQLAAELRAGQPPGQALAHTARSWPELEPAATAARLGGSVPDALRALSVVVAGGAALARVAAAWQVAHRTGAGLAGVLGRLADGLREQDATRQEVMATLAAPRATARLLALLPAFGLLLGEGLGADPWRFLVASPLGLLCLALGCGLALAGLAWVERLADRAEALR